MTFLYGLIAAHPGVAAAAGTSPAKSTTTSGFGAWGLWVILGLMFVVMYFVLYRPQRKRAQEAQNLLTQLQKGDEVVTIGGIHGVIKRLTDDTVLLEVDKGVRMTFSRSAISRTLTVQEPEVEEEEELPAEPEEGEEEYEETEEAWAEEGEEAEAEPEEEPEAEDTSGGDGEKGKK
jgi:preprotein translocase subunit YajC